MKGDEHVPASKLDYLKTDYWDKRFESESHYEWFGGYDQFRNLVRCHLQPDGKLLVLGPGNSSLPLDLRNDGLQDVTAVDISAVVVSKMTQQVAHVVASGLQYVVGDMMNLSFPENHFDSIIEKGTLDVLFVENDSSWNPRPEVQENVHRMLEETHRVLKDGGVFVSITFMQPHFRKPFLTAEQYTWSCDVSSYGGGHSLEYFVYVMKKGHRVKDQSDGKLKPRQQMVLDIVQNHVDDEDFLSYIEI